MDPYASAWAGIGALVDLTTYVGDVADATSATAWARERLDALPAPGSPWTWADVAAWDAGIVPNVASSPAEARAAWLARLFYSLGYVHGPLATLGWQQSTPDARARWSSITVGTAIARQLIDGYLADRPAESVSLLSIASELAKAELDTAATWGQTAKTDSDELLPELPELPKWALPVTLGGAALSLLPLLTTGVDMARRKRRTTKKKTTRRRRATAKGPGTQEVALGLAGSAAAGYILPMTGALTPDDGESAPDKASSATPALVAGAAGIGVAMLGGRDKGTEAALARGVGDGVTAVAAAMLAVGSRGRAALGAAQRVTSSDAAERARAKTVLQAVASTPAETSGRSRARRVSPEAAARMQHAAKARLGLANAGVHYAGKTDGLHLATAGLSSRSASPMRRGRGL